MDKTYDSLSGSVNLEGTTEYHNPDFGYTLFEEVVDPANPEGPRAIAMHLPANSLSRVWQLIEPGYQERIELLSGEASLVHCRAKTDDWTTMFLSPENPTGDGIILGEGDMFCVVTADEEAVMLSRPSKPFDISFEVGKTEHPEDALSQFVLTHVASIE